MSNATLKEQLQAVASQLSDKSDKSPHAKQTIHSGGKTSKQKPRWLEYVQYGVELLKAYFPAAFKEANEVKPLKKGIKQDLVKRLSTIDTIVTEDKACMVKSLAYYVNTITYHKGVVCGALRIDLDGHPAGAVNALEEKYSAERFQAKIQAKQNAKLRLEPTDTE